MKYNLRRNHLRLLIIYELPGAEIRSSFEALKLLFLLPPILSYHVEEGEEYLSQSNISTPIHSRCIFYKSLHNKLHLEVRSHPKSESATMRILVLLGDVRSVMMQHEGGSDVNI